MNYFYVYGYFDPDTEEIFYIGKGHGERCHKHLKPCEFKKNTFLYKRIRKILRENKFPIIKKLIENISEKTAFFIEKGLIQEYGRKDNGTGILCNHTDGGEGPTGHIHSEETRLKMSLTRKGLIVTIDAVVARAVPRSDKAKKNMSDAAIKNRGISVESYNLKTGKTIKKYPSLSSVKKDGYSFGNVAAVVRGDRPRSYGMGWRCSNE